MQCTNEKKKSGSGTEDKRYMHIKDLMCFPPSRKDTFRNTNFFFLKFYFWVDMYEILK